MELFSSGGVLHVARFPRDVALSNGSMKMNGVIYLVGLVVVVMAVLSLFGLR